MSDNGSVVKISGCGKEKGIMYCWRMLIGYLPLLIVNLFSPPAFASSYTDLGYPSLNVVAAKASAFSTEWSFGLDNPSLGVFAAKVSTLSSDLSKATDFELTSRKFVESRGVTAETGLSLLVWLITVLTSVPMLVVMMEAIAVLGFRQRRVTATPGKEFPRTVVLIPAHNEKDVIGRSLASMAVDLPPNCRLLCIAHNCTDTTAEIARSLGAEVIEVQDEGRGGKPDALKAGLRWLEASPPEIVVVVDADCVVSEGAVRALAQRAWELNRPVMGAYFFAPVDAKKGLATLSSLAVLLKNYVRPLGLHALGLPCLLNGSGSAYPFQVIRNAPHGEGAIAEDYQLSIDLLRQGYPTTFVPEARIQGQLPMREDTALRQRRRWEHGHLFLVFRTGPRLLLEGLRRLDKDCLALAMEVTVPPLAFLGLMWVVAVSLSLALYAFYGHGAPLSFLTGTAAAFAAAVLMSWMRFAGVKQTLTALAAVPGYLMWKLPMYRDFLSRRETRWMKTERDSFNGAQHGLHVPSSG